MAIQQKPGGASKPQAYSTEDGKFVATGDTGSSSSNAAAASAAASTAPTNSSLFNKLFTSQNNMKKPSLADRLFSPVNDGDNDDQEEDFTSYLESLNSRDNDSNWHKTHDLLTVDTLIENIDKYVSDNILDFIRKYPRTDGKGKYMWAYDRLGGVSAEYGSPRIFLNAIAQEQFVPAQLIGKEEFDAIKQSILDINNWAYTGSLGNNGWKIPQGQYMHSQRGSHSTAATLGFLGLRKSDLYLTMGAYDTCVYTAYDESNPRNFRGNTAQGYGNGARGHITEILLDKSKAKICDFDTAERMRDDFLNKESIWKPKMNQALLDKGLSQQDADDFMYVIDKTFKRDRMSVAIACGYDMVYVPQQGYSLFINWKNCKILDKGYKK